MLPLVFALVLAQPADPFARWEMAITTIEKRLQENPNAEGAVFFAGSSSIRLWKLKEEFPGLLTENVGFGGSQIRDTTHFADRILLPYKPKTIVFYSGDNDINAKRTPQQVAEDFRAFTEKVHKSLPNTRILYIPIKPSIARWKQFEQQKQANALVKAQCDKDKRLEYVDIVPGMLGADGQPRPELFVKDGLHLSAAGYAVWKEALKGALK